MHARGSCFLQLVARTLRTDSSIHNCFVILQLMYTTEALSLALAHNRCNIYRICVTSNGFHGNCLPYLRFTRKLSIRRYIMVVLALPRSLYNQDTADVDAQARSVQQPVPDLHGATVHGRRLGFGHGRQLQARGPGASAPIRLKLVLRTSSDAPPCGPSRALPDWGAGAPPCHECPGP